MAPNRSKASTLRTAPVDDEPEPEVDTNFPRVMYNQKNGQTRTVKDEAALDKLGADWEPEPHADFPPQSHGHIEGARPKVH